MSYVDSSGDKIQNHNSLITSKKTAMGQIGQHGHPKISSYFFQKN